MAHQVVELSILDFSGIQFASVVKPTHENCIMSCGGALSLFKISDNFDI